MKLFLSLLALFLDIGGAILLAVPLIASLQRINSKTSVLSRKMYDFANTLSKKYGQEVRGTFFGIIALAASSILTLLFLVSLYFPVLGSIALAASIISTIALGIYALKDVSKLMSKPVERRSVYEAPGAALLGIGVIFAFCLTLVLVVFALLPKVTTAIAVLVVSGFLALNTPLAIQRVFFVFGRYLAKIDQRGIEQIVGLVGVVLLILGFCIQFYINIQFSN